MGKKKKTSTQRVLRLITGIYETVLGVISTIIIYNNIDFSNGEYFINITKSILIIAAIWMTIRGWENIQKSYK